MKGRAQRFGRIIIRTLVFALIGAIQGVIVGLYSMAPMAIDDAMRGQPIRLLGSFMFPIIATVGAMCGAVVGPLIGWLLADRAPPWRAFVEPTLGALMGVVLAWCYLAYLRGLGATELIIGACLGAVVATARLRYEFRNAKPSGARA